jgi:hypothetical protein
VERGKEKKKGTASSRFYGKREETLLPDFTGSNF